MQARDVMTADVVTVKPDDTVADVAQVLMEHHISAAPVCEGDKVVGVISEGDLVRRKEIDTDRTHRSWWLQLFTAESTLSREYTKSHATRVRDLMTDDVISVSEDTPLNELAATLERKRVKRVPVLRDGKLVGIVSRADIVQKLAAHREQPMEASSDDAALRDKILQEVRRQGRRIPVSFNVMVTDGVVDIWGTYRTEEERDSARVAVEGVSGVKKVEDHRRHMRMPYTG